MASDTGAPWNLPYPEDTDLVRDGAQAIQDLAEAAATGLTAAGGLVAVKTVAKTNVFSASVASGASVDVTDLSITHSLADASNRLLLLAQVFTGSSDISGNRAGAAFYDGSSLLNIGDADGSRARVSSIQSLHINGSGGQSTNLMLLHSPPSTASTTYTVRLINANTTATTLYVNRGENDVDDIRLARGASTFTLLEVKV